MKKTSNMTDTQKTKMYLYFELFVIEIFAILNLSHYMRDQDFGFGFTFSIVGTFILVYFSVNRNICPPPGRSKK